MRTKRIFDFFTSFLGLLIIWPLCLVIALAIKIKMPGPVFFTQKRVGRHGKLFTIIKFRTMVLNHNGGTISVRGDSRITSLGSWLRKYKLDELPELWNVLKGEMSLVGPRPDVPGYADMLIGEDQKILQMRPGITGPASLKYFNEEDILAEQDDPIEYANKIIYPDKIRINLAYQKNRTFWMDIKIIFYTIFRNDSNIAMTLILVGCGDI